MYKKKFNYKVKMLMKSTGGGVSGPEQSDAYEPFTRSALLHASGDQVE